MDFDFEVVFNSKQTFENWENSFRNQRQLNNGVCPIAKGYDAAELGIVEFGSDAPESSNAMGFGINGVAFQFANQLQEDPVYPITETNEQPLDLCLGHNQQNSDSGMYHYHALSPCLNATFMDGKVMSECASHEECSDSKVEWFMSGFSSLQSKTVMGLAKDGHVLYGPYDEVGKLWQTDEVDACNGAWSADRSDFYYVGTQWHPYLVGCLGSANLPQNEDPPLYAQCSTNGMDQYVSSGTIGVLPAEQGADSHSMGGSLRGMLSSQAGGRAGQGPRKRMTQEQLDPTRAGL